MYENAIKIWKWLTELSPEKYVRAIFLLIVVAVAFMYVKKANSYKDLEDKIYEQYADESDELKRIIFGRGKRMKDYKDRLAECQDEILELERKEKELYRELYLRSDKNYRVIQEIKKDVNETIKELQDETN